MLRHGVLVSDRFALVVARAMRAERARMGLSQSELGERLGRSQAWVAAVETSQRQLPTSLLPDVCRAFGITLQLLFAHADPDDRAAMGL